MKPAVIVFMMVFLAACTATPTGNVVGPVEDPVDTYPVIEENPFINGGYHEIHIDGFHFTPKNITVYQGDRVKWINDMIFVKSIWIWGDAPGPIINPGKEWSTFFLEDGFFKYRDRFSQDMEGNITVLPYEERPDIKAKLEAEASE